MKIGIDISQIAHDRTGVGNFVLNLVEELIENGSDNEFILFYSSLRKELPDSKFWTKGHIITPENVPHHVKNVTITIKQFKIPPTLLDVLWNKLHIFPIEWFIGDVDVFITSDWTEPPALRAKKVTILYDFIVYKYPEETDNKIVVTQKRKLSWSKKECCKFLCISEATKKDAMEILEIPDEKLVVTYPGI